MPRKRTKTPTNFDKEFPRMLRGLMKDTGHTQDELANYIRKKKNLEKFSRQSVSYYCDGSSSPDWETLNVIADFFGVSVGYLTGHEEYKTLDPDVRMICEYTGLSEQAVNNFNKVSTTPSGERVKLEGLSQFFGRSVQVVRLLNKNLTKAINAPNGNNAHDLNGSFIQAVSELETHYNLEDEGKSFLNRLRDLGAEIVIPSKSAEYWKDRTRDTVAFFIDRIREEIADREAMIDVSLQFPADSSEEED